MKQLVAFTRKEFTEIYRTKRLLVMIIIFAIFGIMSPALAKLTPWLYDTLAGSMAQQGIVVTKIDVTALTSWTQFYKNISMGLIVLVVMFCGILTTEYQKGTLINMLARGLSRWKVILAKSTTALLVWSLCYWLCFGITYAYNAYFWDNSIASHLLAAGACIFLLGVWFIGLIMLGSCFFRTSSAVLLAAGGAVAIIYLVSMLPKTAKYMPTQLLSSGDMLGGASSLTDFVPAIVVTLGMTVISLMATVLKFNKTQI